MAKLALLGGKPVRMKSDSWPQWPMSDASDAKLVADITRSNRWSYDGPYEWKFAEAFAKYQGSKYGLCCANGTVGIQLVLEALGIGAYDEVIVPGMTWQATAAAVADVNAVPVLVDGEPDTWCIDVNAIEAAITRKTKAIIIVHLYGSMPDVTKIQKLCKKKKLFLIEDCAHQHGAFWKGKGVGTLGDAASFSFQETKVLSAGEGGFNMCQSKDLFLKLYSLRNCGRPYDASPAVFGLDKAASMDTTLQSGNYRLTEWQAAMLLGGLKRLKKQVELRDENAQYLNSLLAEIPGVLPMRRRKEITRASYFNFAFRLDWDELGVKGLTNAEFCLALQKELHAEFEPPYEPLNMCGLYKPRTKKRHKIEGEYWKALNPKQFKLPVIEDAHKKSGVVVHHNVLLGSKKDMECIADGVKKVVDNLNDLKKVGKAELKKYRALVQ